MEKAPKREGKGTVKVLFFGTSRFAVSPLRELINSLSFDVVGVVSTPDKTGKRGKKLIQPPVKEEALKHSIEVFQPEKLKEPETKEKIKQFGADIFVVVSYGKFIPDELLEIPPKGALNIHPSLLPKYRGPSPINFALLNGDSYTGVSIISVTNKMDAGDIYMQWVEKIHPKDNYTTLHDRLSTVGAKMIKCTLENLNSLKPTPQDDELATYTRIIKKEDGLINFKEETAIQIVNKVRAFVEWPTAYFFYKGKQFKIFEAERVEWKEAQPGKVVKITKKELIVGCKEDAISIKRIQPQSRKVMDIQAFLAGYRFDVGEEIQ